MSLPMLMMVLIIVVVFPMQFIDSYIYIYLLFCELTPSAGIAALWASAGNEG